MPPKKDKGKEKMAEGKSSKEKYRRVTPDKKKKKGKHTEEESESSRRARRRKMWTEKKGVKEHRPIGYSADESTSTEEESIAPEKEQRRTGNFKAITIRSITAAKRRDDISEFDKN